MYYIHDFYFTQLIFNCFIPNSLREYMGTFTSKLLTAVDYSSKVQKTWL